jgi:hypothetical protein
MMNRIMTISCLLFLALIVKVYAQSESTPEPDPGHNQYKKGGMRKTL